METIKIKYLADITKVEKIPQGDWVDLRCAEDIEMKAGDFKLIPLGVAMQLPEGYEAHLTSRSSMYKKHGIFHCDDVGVIDNTYCGDNDQWFLPVVALQDTFIEKDTRICQFRIQKIQPELRFVEVESLGNPDRGGIGSTGEK